MWCTSQRSCLPAPRSRSSSSDALEHGDAAALDRLIEVHPGISRVLLVDDNGDVGRLLHRLRERAGASSRTRPRSSARSSATVRTSTLRLSGQDIKRPRCTGPRAMTTSSSSTHCSMPVPTSNVQALPSDGGPPLQSATGLRADAGRSQTRGAGRRLLCLARRGARHDARTRPRCWRTRLVRG